MADEDFQQLKALNVTAILSLQTEEDGPEGAIESERSAAVEAGMGFTNLPVTDFDRLELLWKLPKCVATVQGILAAGATLYLHCTAGVNRSPTVAVAYLHGCLQWPLEQALEHIRACRACSPDADVIRRANVHCVSRGSESRFRINAAKWAVGDERDCHGTSLG